LEFLDGVRGWAALYVVLAHASYGAFVESRGTFWQVIEELLGYGRTAVAIFIVLSGFCLMLPVCINLDQPRKLGWWATYVKRRFRRIVPPYFAALTVSLLLLATLPQWITQHGWAKSFWPAFELDIIVTHALLIHNLSNDWVSRINPPFWSVATEWQIYFLFPLILLPTLKRFGWLACIVAGFVLPLVLIFAARQFDSAAPWFLGLFALGMSSAWLAVSEHPKHQRDRRWLSHPVLLMIGLFIVIAAAGWKTYGPLAGNWKSQFIYESVVGVACAAVLLWLCGKQPLKAGHTPVRGAGGRAVAMALECGPARWLGKISYSLYLTHALAIMLTAPLITRAQLTGSMHTLLHLGAAVGLSLLLARGFYQWFERPFVSQPKKNEAAAPQPSPESIAASHPLPSLPATDKAQ